MGMVGRVLGAALLASAGGTAKADAAPTRSSPIAAAPVALDGFDPPDDLAGPRPDYRDLPGLRRSLLPRLFAVADRTALRLQYRLLWDRAPGFALVTAPLGVPAASVGRPGGRRARLLLPVWSQMAFGAWSGPGDFTSGPAAGFRAPWRSGLAVIRTISPRLSVGAEFSHESADMIDGHANNGVGVGARYRLTGPLSLMVTGGPYVEHHGGVGMRASTALSLAF